MPSPLMLLCVAPSTQPPLIAPMLVWAPVQLSCWCAPRTIDTPGVCAVGCVLLCSTHTEGGDPGILSFF